MEGFASKRKKFEDQQSNNGEYKGLKRINSTEDFTHSEEKNKSNKAIDDDELIH